MNGNFQQPILSNLARRFATIIALLFARQGLTGKLTEVTRAARHLSLGVRLSNPAKLDKALNLGEPLALAAGCEAVISERRAGLVVYQFELPQGHWEYYTRADLPDKQAVGLAERRRPVTFELDPPHALIAGTSGSGKTEAIKSALIALLITHAPHALALAIVDPHSDYGDFQNVAHLAAPIAHEPGEIQAVLGWATQEMATRKADNLRDAAPVVVVIDEAHEALTDGKALAMAQTLAQGRKYRIHLIVGTQKPLHGDLPKILDNLDNRFVGRVTDAKVSATVTGQAGLSAHKLTGKGDFLHVTGPSVTRFQVAMATRPDFERLPRAEVVTPKVDTTDLIDLPALIDYASYPVGDKPIGRPALEVSPAIAAQYFWRNPESISIAMARELFGLSRTGHELHKNFALEFITELKRLRAAKGA